jgi:hypothetical protein
VKQRAPPPLQLRLALLLETMKEQRAGFNGTPGHLIQRQLRHKKFDTTVGYIQEAELLKKNAAGMAGL